MSQDDGGGMRLRLMVEIAIVVFQVIILGFGADIRSSVHRQADALDRAEARVTIVEAEIKSDNDQRHSPRLDAQAVRIGELERLISEGGRWTVEHQIESERRHADEIARIWSAIREDGSG